MPAARPLDAGSTYGYNSKGGADDSATGGCSSAPSSASYYIYLLELDSTRSFPYISRDPSYSANMRAYYSSLMFAGRSAEVSLLLLLLLLVWVVDDELAACNEVFHMELTEAAAAAVGCWVWI